jgi:hypothetical protein
MRLHRVLVGWTIISGFSFVNAQTKVDLRTQAKSVDFSGATSTRPIQTGTALPGTCAVGQMFFLTSTTPGLNVYACTATNTWTPNGAGLPHYTQSFSAQTSVALAHNLGTSNIIVQCYDSGNTQISYATFAVSDQNNAAVTFFSSQTGRCVVSGYGGVMSRYSATFTSQTSVVITAATHNLGTGDISVTCFDGGTPKNRIEPDHVQIDASSNVTITFFSAQSGRCILQ